MKKLIKISKDSLDLADNRAIIDDDRIHEVIFRLKSDMILLLVKSLNRGLCLKGALYHCYDDISVCRGLIFLHNQVITVVDTGIDHAVSVHYKQEVVAISDKPGGEWNAVFDILLGQDRYQFIVVLIKAAKNIIPTLDS